MKFSLTRLQFFLTLFIIQTGSVFISFQTPLIKAAGRDAWIIFLIAGVIHYGQLLFFEKYHMFFEFGPILQWIYKSYWLLITVVYIAYLEYALSIWGFPATPSIVIITLIVLISYYAIIGGPHIVLSLGVLLIPLIPLVIFFLLFTSPDFVWTNLFPMGNINVSELKNGMLQSNIAFVGVEIFFVYRSAILKTEIIKGFHILIYNSILTAFYLITILSTLLFFALKEIELIPEPVAYILKSQEVTFLERIDLFFIFIWMMWSIVGIVYLVFTIWIVHEKKTRKKPKQQKIILHVLLIVLPLFLVSKIEIMKFQNILIYCHILFSMIIPVVVVFMNKWRSSRAEKV